jgi:hypothetical protein
MVTLPLLGLSDSNNSLSSDVLPEPDGAGEKMEGARLDAKAQIPEDFGALAIA